MKNIIIKDKIKLIASSVFILFIALLAVSGNNKQTPAREHEMCIETLSIDIGNIISNNPSLGLSSNPYDYIHYSDEYINIVKMGIDALSEIVKIIKNSPNNRLDEYILAIAAEEIINNDSKKINLKNTYQKWELGNRKRVG